MASSNLCAWDANGPRRAWTTRSRTSRGSSGNADLKPLQDRLSAGSVARTESNAKTLTELTTLDGKPISCNEQNEDNDKYDLSNMTPGGLTSSEILVAKKNHNQKKWDV